MNKIIRPAGTADAAAMINIYAPYILDSAVSFELTVPTKQEFTARIAASHIWIVCEADGQIVGYAYASKHRERAAYQWCCEVSAYVDEKWHGQGIASALYEKLFTQLREKGFVNAYAGITLPNRKSVAFHEANGFKPIGTYEKIGFKFGAWHDVGWWGLRLTPISPCPLQPPGL